MTVGLSEAHIGSELCAGLMSNRVKGVPIYQYTYIV